MDSWDHYRSLLAVLGEGSLSGAARQLGLTQPTIGRHIEALESELGAALFTRSASGLAPTETALALRPHAEAMSAAAEALVRTASGEADAVRGTMQDHRVGRRQRRGAAADAGGLPRGLPGGGDRAVAVQPA